MNWLYAGYRQAKQRLFGHAKIASRALLRLGLSEITNLHGQCPAGDRRAQLAAARLLRPWWRPPSQAAITRKRSTGRDDHGAWRLDVRHEKGDHHLRGRRRAVALVGEPATIAAAIEAIEKPPTPVHYPGAMEDPDTGRLISDAQVAETSYNLRLGSGRTLAVRLVVRR